MMKNATVQFVLSCCCVFLLRGAGEGAIIVGDYGKKVDFTGQADVLIQKGDDQAFKDPGYDDSGWSRVSLPSNWIDLFPESPEICWYRIHVSLPRSRPESVLGIRLGVISDVDEAFFNGTLIGRSGKFPPHRVSAYDRVRIYEIPAQLMEPGDRNVLSIRVAGFFPYEKGPVKGSFLIAPYKTLLRDFFARELVDIFFVMIYVAVAAYFAMIFITRSIDREYLFFSLFTLAVSVYLLLRTQVKYFIIDDFTLLKRIEYIFLFIIPVLMMEYITEFFSKKRGFIHTLYYAATGAAVIAVLVSGDILTWNRILLWGIEPTWIIPVGYSILTAFAGYRNEKDALTIIITFSLLSVIFLYDVMVDRTIIESARLALYGFMIVIAGSAWIMRRRFIRLYHDAEAFRNRRRGISSINEAARKKLDCAIEYIKENYREDISREGLAESVGLHHDYFGKIFRQYTGMKIGEYINDLRIRAACGMLVKGDESVTDIAFGAGFENLSTFYRVFQDVMKDNPTSWLEKQGKKN